MTVISDSIGRVLGKRYRLVSLLGTGASAHVYLAEDDVLQRRVAVKVLQPALARDDRFLRRFWAEARAAGSLNHPNVLRVLDWGEDPDGPYLVLEHLAGGTLRELLDRGALLDVAQAARVGREAADGLAYAHACGLVHRDVKPANLLFDEEGRVRVADFGVARALAEATWTEPAGAMVGTIRYAAPEQAEAQPVEGRSDVYALALVLYEAVTGEVPFVEDAPLTTLMARVGATLPSDPRLGLLEPLLRSAAAPVLGDRPDATGLSTDLAALAASLPPPARLPIQLAVDGPPGIGGPALGAGGAGETGGGAAPPDLTAVGVPATPATPGASRDGRGDGTALGTPAELAAGGAAPPAIPPQSEAAAPGDPGVPASVHQVASQTSVHVAAPPPAPAHGAMPPAPAHGAMPPAPPIVRRRRRRWPWVVALCVILVLAAGALVAVREQVFTPSHPIPSVTGQTLAGARQRLAARHLTMRTAAAVYSTTVPAGHVVRQRPAASMVVKEGTVVTVVPSKGVPPVVVPSLAGLDCTAAQRVLAVADLTGTCPPDKAQYSATVSSGEVITWSVNGQDRPTQAPWHSTVVIELSKGPTPVAVPQVAAKTYAEAAAALAAVGLPASGSPQSSTTVPNGEVISTDPAAGQQVPEGTTVTVYVSTGLPTVTVPTSIIGETVAKARAALSALGLAVAKTSGHGTLVTSSDPAPGQTVPVGTTVTLHAQSPHTTPTAPAAGGTGNGDTGGTPGGPGGGAGNGGSDGGISKGSDQ